MQRRPVGKRPGGATVDDVSSVHNGFDGLDHNAPADHDDGPGRPDNPSPHDNGDPEKDNHPPPNDHPPAAGLALVAVEARFLPTTVVVTVEQTPATTTVTLPPTSVPVPTSAPPKTAAKAPVRKATPTRKAPQYGYQCRDGDEAKYQVCAGHKAWVDGQLEFTGCLDGGGTWDADTQRCVRP